VVYDPPLFSAEQQFLFSIAFRFIPDSIVSKYHPLIKASLRKKSEFTNRRDARDWVKGRRLFMSFDPSIVEAFVEHGFVRADGVNDDVSDRDESPLVFDYTPQQEANMYRSTPMGTPLIGVNGEIMQYQFPQSSSSPGDTTFMYCEKHEFLSQSDVSYLKSIAPNMSFVDTGCKGGHFWPMQDPKAFAVRVLEVM
jgi:hypothetical protein